MIPDAATGSADESARLAALHRYRILDTEPERGFDDLTLLASYICETPMAAITLIDADRQWFKSRVGISITETARAVSFCTHAIRARFDSTSESCRYPYRPSAGRRLVQLG